MNEIIESIINGQRKQAIKQLKDANLCLDNLFESLIDDGLCSGCSIMYRIAINVCYIEVK